MSSSTRRAASPADVWRTLALLRDGEYCRTDWQRRLGTGFGPLAGFLELLPGTVAETVPHPQSGLPLIPRRVHDGTYTARPDDPHATRVDALRGIAPAAVARWRLRWDKIGEAVAGAFGIEPHSGTGPFDTPWVQSIGVLRANDAVFGALLLVAKSDVDALGWVRHLVRGESRLFILPFHDPLCADLAAAHGHRYLALDRDAQFVFSKGLWGIEARIVESKATANAAAWSKAELEKVAIVGDFNLVRFADGLEISFHRRARCRAYLVFLMDRCVRRNEFVFDHQTIVTDYNETKPLRPIKSERLDHDLFKQVKGFDRLFETVDRAKQRFRLLIRRR